VPYTIYTTGIAWRKDHVNENPYAMANPWAMPWQAKYKDKVAILDDARESISLGLMKKGAAAAAQPGLYRGPPLVLQARDHGTADPDGHQRPVGAGVAPGQERVGGPG
jgi:spermidine/putrescine-binding protein